MRLHNWTILATRAKSMNTTLIALQKSLEEAKTQIEHLKQDFPPDDRLVNEFDGVLDIEMGLDWTLKQVEFFAAHFPSVHAPKRRALNRVDEADFDYDPVEVVVSR
jgi:hypothetical protein